MNPRSHFSRDARHYKCLSTRISREKLCHTLEIGLHTRTRRRSSLNLFWTPNNRRDLKTCSSVANSISSNFSVKVKLCEFYLYVKYYCSYETTGLASVSDAVFRKIGRLPQNTKKLNLCIQYFESPICITNNGQYRNLIVFAGNRTIHN